LQRQTLRQTDFNATATVVLTSCIRHCLQDTALLVGELRPKCACSNLCHSLSSAAALCQAVHIWLQQHRSCKLSCRKIRINTFGGSRAHAALSMSLCGSAVIAAAGVAADASPVAAIDTKP
jgi:hypothetical protein